MVNSRQLRLPPTKTKNKELATSDRLCQGGGGGGGGGGQPSYPSATLAHQVQTLYTRAGCHPLANSALSLALVDVRSIVAATRARAISTTINDFIRSIRASRVATTASRASPGCRLLIAGCRLETTNRARSRQLCRVHLVNGDWSCQPTCLHTISMDTTLRLDVVAMLI